MRKNLIILTVCIFWAFSCNLDGDSDSTNFGSSINIVNVSANQLLAPDGFSPTAISAAVGANDFSFRLGRILLEHNRGGNFVFSPYSVWMPLAALVNATDAQYKSTLLNALDASGISQDDLNIAASRMLYDLTDSRNAGTESYYNPLKILNAIFVDNKVTLRRDFAQTYMDFYRGASINVDFSSRDAVNAVNRWARANTNGLISDLIESFDPDTVAAIANAIYFSDRWAWEFNIQETQEDFFYGPLGNTRAFYMLREGSDQLYFEDNRVQAISLGFKHSAGMNIILPKSGSAENLFLSMTNDYFNEIQQNSILAEGRLLLPRFSIENDIEGLSDSLKTLGVPLFEGEPITGLIEEDFSLLITDAIQRAVIKVDERGTTAAAVTVLPIGPTSAPPQPNRPFEMICNKPFMFILYDQTYDGGSQVLFTGIVNQP